MKYKRSFASVVVDTMNYMILGIFTLLCFFPFYYLFINSISDNTLSSNGLILFWPKGVHFENYIKVMQIRGLGQATLVSLARTAIGTASNVLCSGFLAYAITKKELFARKFCYRFVLVTMYLNAGIIPWYMNMKMLGLTDNFLAYVIGVISPFSLILFKTYVESLPASLEESAQIDGAGYITIFFKIIAPLSLPIIATLAVFTAVWQWNSFIDTLFLMNDSKYYTLQYVLYRYLMEVQSIARAMQQASQSGGGFVAPPRQLNATSIRMTLTMVVVFPVLLVYPFFQRYFVKGIMIGAVKG